tara:strand:+ start:1943 stop:2272 length:330 start_codon:yes stop_codon:yes gene_type:complete
MAITANMTTHEGIALSNVYVRVNQSSVKKMKETDESGNKSDLWKLVYDVLIYKDKETRDDEMKEQSMRIYNRHVDHFKINYTLDATDNPIKIAYADLKGNDQLSNIKDA